MAALSEWLQLMLAEIARKREDLEQAREEENKRMGETQPGVTHSSTVQPKREARAAVAN
jgi:hypothetical protein